MAIGKRVWFGLPILIFILLRVVLLYVLYYVTGGSEFTSDFWVFDLGSRPLAVITFATDVSGYSQPPLYPLVLAPFAFLSSAVFNNFLASRISFTLFEFIAFLITARLLAVSDDIDNRGGMKALFIMAVSPLGFMVGTVMRQEEAIVAIFVAAVLFAVKKGYIRGAALLAFFGTITGKILFGLMFFPLILLKGSRKEVLVYGIIPSAIVIPLYYLIGYSRTGIIPFISFAPSDIRFCTSSIRFLVYFWNFSGDFIKWFSISILAIALIILWGKFRTIEKRDFPMMVLLSFSVLYLCFYHVNPEYYIFILPLLAIIPVSSRFSRFATPLYWGHIVLAIGSWGHNILFGIRMFARGESAYSHSKEMVLQFYNRFFGFLPIKTVEMALLALTLLSLCLILYISYHGLTYVRKEDGRIGMS